MFLNLASFFFRGGGCSRQTPPPFSAPINPAYLSKPQFSIVCVGGGCSMKNRLTPSLRTWRKVSCYIVSVYHLLFHSPQTFLIQGSYPNVDTDMEGVLKPHVRS